MGFPSSLTPVALFTQETPAGLEIALVSATRRPSPPDIRRAWDKRRAGRVTPVLMVVLYPTADGQKATLCGPTDQQSVHRDLDPSQVERLAAHALTEPTHHAATRFLLANLPELDSPLPGIRNVGLLATQELQAGVPLRPDWKATVAKSTPLLSLRGTRLMERLGFGVTPLASNASMLTINGHKRAVGIFCDDTEPFEAPSQRFGNVSPVSRALAIADRENVDWVILTRSAEIRLYAARPDTGVGRKGRAETFIEINLALVPGDQSGYLHLLFSAQALDHNGTIEEILTNSADFAAELAVRLRERVYNDTVPLLSQAVAKRMGRRSTANDLTEEDLAAAYELVMVILFRLLFVAYAEDKGLLPYRQNDQYTNHSLSRAIHLIVQNRDQGITEFDQEATDLWEDVNQLWRVIDRGNITWGVPAYDGGLFSTDPAVNPSAEALANLRLTDAEFGPALAALLIDQGPEGEGPVDFRSLSVREFGTIYEGLLESRLSVAQSDLALNRKGEYIPATAAPKKRLKPVQVVVPEGMVYLHNRSGVRKATGSYFTKPFAVEHLLDHALEVALDDHLARLDTLREAGDEAALSEAFFDFRCADIAMGSGHFLVAAVDRIEARLSAWLSLHPVPSVVAELGRLRETALRALGKLAAGVEIESGSLLRRQVARHCIYGVDKNRIAVELARLAIWVHTFVPGLPLSFLDHNLVCGDSLTGVGTLDEVAKTLDPKAKPGAPSLPRSRLESQLAEARGALRRLARTSDATKKEIDEARAAHQQAQTAVMPARNMFDVVTAIRADACQAPYDFDDATIAKLRADPEVADTVRRLNPVHFPAAFPEVFLRDRPGFDCLLGNPPWERLVVDRKIWWGLHLPGVRSLPVARRRALIDEFEASRPDLAAEFKTDKQQADALKKILRLSFPKLGAGSTDLYKAFSWANLSLVREGGSVGTVLPRSAVADAGMAKWRTEILNDTGRAGQGRAGQGRAGQGRAGQGRAGQGRASVCTLINNRGWVFEGVHNAYTVALVSFRRLCRLPPVSTPASGLSTGSTGATPSPWLPSGSSRSTPTPGGGFEDATYQPCVALYPGPANSLTHYQQIIAEKPEQVPVSEFLTWSNSAAFPQIPTRAAFRVWRKMKEHPRFISPNAEPPPDGGYARYKATSTRQPTATGSSGTAGVALPSSGGTPRHPRQDPSHERRWRLRPVREFDASRDRGLFVNDDGLAAESLSDSIWPVYNGASLNVWEPETGVLYDSVNAEEIVRHLHNKRLRQRRTTRSAFAEQGRVITDDPSTLPCLHPRVAFRDVTNPTNTRTVICALVPGERVLVHKAPFLLQIAGSNIDEAYLLGVLCSMPCDWQARRTVELNMSFQQLSLLTIPDPGPRDRVRARVVEIAGRLAAVDDRFSEWAAEVGVPVGSATDPAIKQDLIHELDACVAHLYGLDEDDLAVIYETFDHKDPNRYADRHAAVLKHFRRIT